MRLKEVSPSFGQRDEGGLPVLVDVRDRVHETKLAQVPEIAIARICGPAMMIFEVTPWNDAECANRRKDANLRRPEVVDVGSIPNWPA